MDNDGNANGEQTPEEMFLEKVHAELYLARFRRVSELMGSSAQAVGEEIGEDFFVVLICYNALVVCLGIVSFAFDSGEIFGESILILFGYEIGFRNEDRFIFEVNETMRTIKAKIEFLSVKEME